MLRAEDIHTDTRVENGTLTSIAIIAAKNAKEPNIDTEKMLKEYLINMIYGDLFRNLQGLKDFILCNVKPESAENVEKAIDRILRLMDIQV